MEIINTVLRSTFAYVLALTLTRLMGRKLVSQMTFFDFVLGVTLGSVVATLAIGSKVTPVSAAIVLIILSALVILIDYSHIKSFRLRKLVNSEPVTLINNGNIVEDNMKKIRITVDELMMKLGEKDIFNAADVEFAIMETDGELSVLQKPDKLPLTPKDMKMKAASKGMAKDIIIDGNIMSENLKAANLSKDWLMKELNSQGIRNPKEVFYAGVDNNKTLYVSKKSNNQEKDGMYGIE